jgi:hypothetical protein
MCSAGGAQGLLERVAPLGNPRLGLLGSSPRLFAVLPRPSSALDAKASTVRLIRLTRFRFDISPAYSVVKVLYILRRLGDLRQAVRLVIITRFFRLNFLPRHFYNHYLLFTKYGTLQR